MNKVITLCALLCVLALPCMASAEAGMYITPKFLDSLQNSGSLGGSDGLSSQTHNSVGGALAVGMNLRNMSESGIPLRVEVEYATRGNTRSEWNASYGHRQDVKATWQVQTFQLNGYYDIDTGSAFTPYIGAGLGASAIYESMTSGPSSYRHHTEDTTMGFAWNVGAGFAYAFTDNVALDIGYRFAGFGNGSVKHNGNDVENYMTANEFMAGVRFSF
ncbi:MAG: outer membrane beta-barrel protein [Desulfovibrionaceae bacterium]